ncbi:MAG: hypothetical protein L6R41_005991 [Letrouitia leprolyta]|nr:MAG: hypothetical protein L6R41_005991 [Letrouitia leprolyta]
MSGRLFLVTLPEWREEKEEYLQPAEPEKPVEPNTKSRKWLFKRLFHKKKTKKELDEMKARAEALVTSPHIEGQIRLVVKAKILGSAWRLAWAGISIPPTATYREFAGYALKELRRQNAHPSRIAKSFLVRGLVVQWGTKDRRGRSLPRLLDEDNFQGSLMMYEGGSNDEDSPPEMEIIVQMASQPTPKTLQMASQPTPIAPVPEVPTPRANTM